MRSLLTLVGAAVVTFAVVGYFLGWYQVHTAPGPDGHRKVDIDFNAQQFQQDVEKAKDQIFKASHQGPSGQTAPDTPATGSVALPTPPGAIPQGLPVPGMPLNVNPTPQTVPAGTFTLPLAPSSGAPVPGTVVVHPAGPPVPAANLAWPPPQK